MKVDLFPQPVNYYVPWLVALAPLLSQHGPVYSGYVVVFFSPKSREFPEDSLSLSLSSPSVTVLINCLLLEY